MQGRRLRKWIGILLLITFPSSLMLADAKATALLLSAGRVTVNGALAPRSTALFSGDRVQTEDGAVSISKAGSTVMVFPNSSVVLEDAALRIVSGGASISTSRGMSVHTRLYVIAPANGSATFKIGKRDGNVLVIAQRGMVRINGALNTSLAEGGSMTLAEDPQKGPPAPGTGVQQSEPTKEQEQEKQKGQPGVPPAPVTGLGPVPSPEVLPPGGPAQAPGAPPPGTAAGVQPQEPAAGATGQVAQTPPGAPPAGTAVGIQGEKPQGQGEERTESREARRSPATPILIAGAGKAAAGAHWGLLAAIIGGAGAAGLLGMMAGGGGKAPPVSPYVP